MARETLAARRSRYAIKHEAIGHIAILERATNAAFQVLTTTRQNCPCCKQDYFPMDTPEYAAWSAAHATERRAICVAVDSGQIAENDAAIRFGMTIEEIRDSITLYNLTRTREAQEDGDRFDREEIARGEDRPESTTTGATGGA